MINFQKRSSGGGSRGSKPFKNLHTKNFSSGTDIRNISILHIHWNRIRPKISFRIRIQAVSTNYLEINIK